MLPLVVLSLVTRIACLATERQRVTSEAVVDFSGVVTSFDGRLLQVTGACARCERLTLVLDGRDNVLDRST